MGETTWESRQRSCVESRKARCSENKDQVTREAEKPRREMLKGLKVWALRKPSKLSSASLQDPGEEVVLKSKEEWRVQKAETSTTDIEDNVMGSQRQEGV